jgi:hypothetical protein
VVYDDRGHFIEPHTGLLIGLGGLNVRDYLSKCRPAGIDEAGFAAAAASTYGPDGCFGALLYVEKEGFMPLFQRVRLAQRYDLAIMSSKGMSVIAARELADGICGGYGIPLLVLHDFDSAGIVIKDTLENSTRRYAYKCAPTVIDLGLQFEDIGDLEEEENDSRISTERLREAGQSDEAIEFLQESRVELNAMTSRELVDFVETKLQQHGIGKVIPDEAMLAKAYRTFVASQRLSDAFATMKDELDAETAEPIEAPPDLGAKVEERLRKSPHMPWHHAVKAIVDPDLEDEEEEEEDEQDDDEEDEP